MQNTIIDRGRGPEIAGTRITVYDIMDYYYQSGWNNAAIAAFLRLSPAQVQAAIDYIEEHKQQVLADYKEILARSARGNPPELQAKLDAISAECRAQREERRHQSRTSRNNHEGNPG
jgi:uncharacterized protein (DUF433 family)